MFLYIKSQVSKSNRQQPVDHTDWGFEWVNIAVVKMENKAPAVHQFEQTQKLSTQAKNRRIRALFHEQKTPRYLETGVISKHFC